jgi:hypothetical protein
MDMQPGKKGRVFFSEEKKQKTFIAWPFGHPRLGRGTKGAIALIHPGAQ